VSKPFKIVAAVAAVLVIAAGAGLYWGQHKKAQLRGDIATLVADASARLRSALGLEADQKSADTADSVAQLEQDSAAFDRQLAALHALDTSRDKALADAAEDYLSTARQLTHYQARMHRMHIDVSGAVQALDEHMRNADRRARGWIGEAMRRKDDLEKKYFDYRMASDGFGDLARTYLDSRKQLAALLGAPAVVDEQLVIDARARAQQAAKETAALVERARQLAAPR
jgi:hypothetical protein